MTITEEGQVGGLRIKDYKKGQLGLSLSSQSVSPQPYDFYQVTTFNEPVLSVNEVENTNGVDIALREKKSKKRGQVLQSSIHVDRVCLWLDQ